MQKIINILKNAVLYLGIPFLAFFYYSGLGFTGKIRMQTDNFNYFKNLAISFLHGRLDIPKCPPGTDCHDMVNYHGKRYLYEPPIPALIYIPLVIIFKENTPDFLIAAIFGTFNVLFISILLNLISKKYNLNLTFFEKIIFSLFWALGTVHFSLSMSGGVWYISQIIAQTFLILSIIFILKNKNYFDLFLSGLFFSMAVYTRNNIVFAFFAIVCIYISLNNINYQDKKYIKKIISIFLSTFLFFSILNMIYNGVRFNWKVFSNGINHHQMAERFVNDFKKYGYFSVVYIPRNFIREVIIPPPFDSKFPFIKFDPEGFGFLWASPLFIFIIPVLIFLIRDLYYYLKENTMPKFFRRQEIIFLTGATISTIGISFVIFLVMNTGWRQFASRFSIDYQIFLFILILFTKRIGKNFKFLMLSYLFLTIISIYINYWGVIFWIRP